MYMRVLYLTLYYPLPTTHYLPLSINTFSLFNYFDQKTKQTILFFFSSFLLFFFLSISYIITSYLPSLSFNSSYSINQSINQSYPRRSWPLFSLNKPPPDPCPNSCRVPHLTKQSSPTSRNNNHTLPELAMAITYSIGSLQTLDPTARRHTPTPTALCLFLTVCLTRSPTAAPDTEVP